MTPDGVDVCVCRRDGVDVCVCRQGGDERVQELHPGGRPPRITRKRFDAPAEAVALFHASIIGALVRRDLSRGDRATSCGDRKGTGLVETGDLHHCQTASEQFGRHRWTTALCRGPRENRLAEMRA